MPAANPPRPVLRATFSFLAAGALVACGFDRARGADDDWAAWRGPHGDGTAAAGQTPPTEFGETKNVVWKTEVPGRGHSSPVVVGTRIFLTTADEQGQVQSVLGFDRAKGTRLWQTETGQGGFPRQIHPKNTHASPTPACDGRHVFAVFHRADGVHLAALDLDGRIVWNKEVGGYVPRAYRYGYAPSPLLYRDAVIVTSDYEDGWLAAFDKSSGRELWRTPRPKQVTYSSPIVARVAGKDQLFLSGAEQIASYDPATGRPLWSAAALALATCGTAVWSGDLIVASGGYPKSETAAVKADGSGTVVWRNRVKCYEQSLVVADGHVYAVDDGGIAYCWDVRTGDEKWKSRLAGPVSASPVVAGGHVYAANEKGTLFVFRADPREFALVSRNQLGDEGFATPAICGGRIYHRSASSAGGRRTETLWCLGR